MDKRYSVIVCLPTFTLTGVLSLETINVLRFRVVFVQNLPSVVNERDSSQFIQSFTAVTVLSSSPVATLIRCPIFVLPALSFVVAVCVLRFLLVQQLGFWRSRGLKMSHMMSVCMAQSSVLLENNNDSSLSMVIGTHTHTHTHTDRHYLPPRTTGSDKGVEKEIVAVTSSTVNSTPFIRALLRV